MKETIEINHFINVSPEEVYNAWLSSYLHTEMTGGEAKVSDIIGDSFYTWDGYIEGKNISLTPFTEIIQSWRTSEFSDEDEDSILKITLTEKGDGTEISLHHSNIPEGQLQYENGWKEHYFQPMTEFFENNRND